MRTTLTIFVNVLYVLSYSLFLVKCFHPNDIQIRIWVNGTFGLFTLFLFIDSQYKSNEEWHMQFHKIAFLSLIVNFLLIIVFYVTDGLSGIDKLLIFNGSVLALSGMILISGGRHGLFNK